LYLLRVVRKAIIKNLEVTLVMELTVSCCPPPSTPALRAR
jgi:hypothetical protein